MDFYFCYFSVYYTLIFMLYNSFYQYEVKTLSQNSTAPKDLRASAKDHT